MYTFKIYGFCFYLFNCYHCSSSYFLPHWILINLSFSSIFIDYSMDSVFNGALMSSAPSLSPITTFDSFQHFSLVFFLLFLSILVLYLSFTFSYFFSFIASAFGTSFLIPPFKYFFLIFSAFFFNASITIIEVFTGFYSSYSLYHIHYFSSFQLIIFFLFFIFFSLFFFINGSSLSC